MESERAGGVLGVQGRKGKITPKLLEEGGCLYYLDSIFFIIFLVLLEEARFLSASIESGQADRQADRAPKEIGYQNQLFIELESINNGDFGPSNLLCT